MLYNGKNLDSLNDFVFLYGPRQANLILIAYASSESRGTFRQKARSLAPLNGWACAVKICHDGMLEDTNSLDGAHMCYRCVNLAKHSSYHMRGDNDYTSQAWEWLKTNNLTLTNIAKDNR